MCGRFQASSSPAELVRWFETTGPVPNLQQRYNASPGQHLPIVLRGAETGKRRLVALRWGLIPAWAKDAKIGYSTINAMAETVAIKPAFRDAFARRRCLVRRRLLRVEAARRQDDAAYRISWRTARRSRSRGCGSSGTPRRTVRRCVPSQSSPASPTPSVRPFTPHAVILDAADWQTWLGEVPARRDELQALLRPYPAERMEAHEIGPRIEM